MRKIVLFISIVLFTTSIVWSQEVLLPLGGNPLLNKKQSTHHNLKSSPKAVHLPFIDDFSNYTLYPDSNLWADNFVFINTQFALFPPTLGVATFDALDQTGIIYPSALFTQFPADTLTSQPIRLDSIFQPSLNALKISDSLYFSFYYQPGGGKGHPWELLGDAPEASDSLVLEFYAPVIQKWKRIWSTKGMPVDSIYKEKSRYFKYVIIPVNDSVQFYKNDFRFRFTNYCSLGNNIIPSWVGNCDQWNIDYVYLGINRTKHDTVRNDITFIEAAPSFLKNYQAMPANQFIAGELKDSLNILLSNIDGASQPLNYRYEIRDASGTLVSTEDRGSGNIPSFWISGYQQDQTFSKPPVSYTFPSVTSSNKTDFEIRHIVKEGVGQDLRSQNDTNIFIQKFGNYYAYDDGTAENGYGLSEIGSKLAYQFNLNHEDTLVAIEMYFNSTFNNSNIIPFHLTVWKDNGSGKPGDTIYQSNPVLANTNTELNQFQTFLLGRNVIVNGKIYVGWTQTTIDNLNVGFDRNTSSESHIFYNASGSWFNTIHIGSLMIRPVFGIEYLGINDLQKENFSVDIFPNPLRTENLQLNFHSNSNLQAKDFSLQVFDILGNKVFQSALENQINLNSLSNGIYFLKVSNLTNGNQLTKKLIITR